MLQFAVANRIHCVGGVRDNIMNSQIKPLKKEDCVEKIIKKYSDTVYKLAFARVRCKEDADDVFQEVFLNYIKNAPEFENAEHEKAWFVRVTLNCCNDIWRKNDKRCEVSLDEARDIAQDSAEENLSLVEYGLNKLEETDRTLIHLYYYEEYSCSEIAKMLGKSSAAVRMQLSRVRKALKKYLQEDGGNA